MKYLLLLYTCCLVPGLSMSQKVPHTLKVMAWNILHGANDIPRGPEQAIGIIRELDPDIILMIETYGSGPKIAEALGYNFHLVAPAGTPLDNKDTNLSIFSKFPFGKRADTDFPFYLGGREVLVHGQPILFLSNWFHYTPWEDEPEKLELDVAGLLEWEQSGTKYEMIQKVLPYLESYSEQSYTTPVILGGDMNAPSHLDWGVETKQLHNGLEVPWFSSTVLEAMGFIDSYRRVNPNPITHPGITWDMPGKKDEHRIDYIYYAGNKLQPLASKTYKAPLGDPIHLNDKTFSYPSDHGIVITTFKIN